MFQVSLTTDNKLVVSVVMVKDILIEEGAGFWNKQGSFLGNSVPDSFVEVSLVPEEYFPHQSYTKTSKQKTDPAVFGETFE